MIEFKVLFRNFNQFKEDCSFQFIKSSVGKTFGLQSLQFTSKKRYFAKTLSRILNLDFDFIIES